MIVLWKGDIRSGQTTVGRTSLDSNGIRVVDVSILIGYFDGTDDQLPA